LRQWEAFDAIEPIGEDWRQTAQITGWIKHLIDVQLSKVGVTATETEEDDFMPVRYIREPKQRKKKAKKPEAVAKSVFSAFGFGK